MKKIEDNSYSYEIKISVVFDKLELTNAFLSEMLQKFNELGVINVNVTMTKITDRVIAQKPAIEKTTTRGRVRSKQTTQSVKDSIKNYIREKGAVTRKDLIDHIRKQLGTQYKETTIVQKVDKTIKDLIKSGEIRKQRRGFFEIGNTIGESEVQAE
jgi:hypothetical protein